MEVDAMMVKAEHTDSPKYFSRNETEDINDFIFTFKKKSQFLKVIL